MVNIMQTNSIPSRSIIADNIKGDIDYIDTFSIEIDNRSDLSIDYLTAILFTSIPVWANGFMKIRDALVKPFGLATGLVPQQKNLRPSLNYKVGERAIFFTVIKKSPNEIVMAEDDKHLYFRTSIHVEVLDNNNRALAHLTTLVQFHNKLGEIYFAPVKPFHKLLMKSILNRFSKRLKSI